MPASPKSDLSDLSDSPTARTQVTRSEAETERLGEELAASLAPSDALILLEGDLGSGKTVLVRGLARALGVDPREIQSPTYTLIHEHRGPGGRLVHVDLYRLEPEELASLGLDELLAGPGVKAVEWADRLTAAWGEVPGAVRVRFRRIGAGERAVSVDTIGAPTQPEGSQ